MSVHGAHNKDACDALIAGNKYFDWIVTTAFYSSIHYIDQKLFPYNLNGKWVYSIDAACRSLRMSKHQCREQIVNNTFQEISVQFKFLLTTCSTARYINYDIPPAKAQLARKYLDFIVEECKKK